MHIEHKAGEKMFVDYTGKKLQIFDSMSGQKKEDWIKANENALWYFGGVPKVIVPDSLKSGVTKANKYEPEINPVYADFARHLRYGNYSSPSPQSKG